MRNCAQCNKNIEHLWKERKFCSRSCSTLFKNINAHSTKNKGKGKPLCVNKGCKERAVSYSHKQCRRCIDSKQAMSYTSNPTKGELVKLYMNKNHRSSAYSYIRWHARDVVLKKHTLPCQSCGYKKHTEVCHIKSIKNFKDTATLNEINDRKNLIFLCPNCHWEFDNNI
jgi:5-methylcytosine-specific restriction endonuclease McrA